ncbi:MAG: metallophosphoesterase [Gemmatimonadota bacterium]|nr:metallophosphoesterase [Gemmatimonadota bacterium]
MPTLVHLSDIHFGPPERQDAVAAVARRFAERRWDVVAISGDLTQRNTRAQFARAKAFVDQARASAPTAVIPGNHDVAWWWCAGGAGVPALMYRGYRKWIATDLEPSLHAPGMTLASINTSHGIQWHTLTTRLRDLSVVGAMRPAQRRRAAAELAAAPAGDLRVLMVHHNVLRGTLSNRWGLTTRERGLDDVASTACELVLCGHDHESQVAQVTRGARRFVVSQVNTLSNRARGGRPVCYHEVAWDEATIGIVRHEWSAAASDFVPAASWSFAR